MCICETTLWSCHHITSDLAMTSADCQRSRRCGENPQPTLHYVWETFSQDHHPCAACIEMKPKKPARGPKKPKGNNNNYDYVAKGTPELKFDTFGECVKHLAGAAAAAAAGRKSEIVLKREELVALKPEGDGGRGSFEVSVAAAARAAGCDVGWRKRNLAARRSWNLMPRLVIKAEEFDREDDCLPVEMEE